MYAAPPHLALCRAVPRRTGRYGNCSRRQVWESKAFARQESFGKRDWVSNRYFSRYTIVVSVSAGFGVGSPYISHECPADSLRFATIHWRIASCVSFMRL